MAEGKGRIEILTYVNKGLKAFWQLATVQDLCMW